VQRRRLRHHPANLLTQHVLLVRRQVHSTLRDASGCQGQLTARRQL
jgi:hypothetical protein